MRLNVHGFRDPSETDYVKVHEVTVTLSERNLKDLISLDTPQRTLHKYLPDGILLIVTAETDKDHYPDSQMVEE